MLLILRSKVEDGGEEELWGREGPKEQRKMSILIVSLSRANFTLDRILKFRLKKKKQWINK